MASQKQIEANRRNAQKSTGPRTEEGKRRSSLNGLKSHLTGLTTIMVDEDSSARTLFVRQYIQAWDPQDAIEHQLALSLALDNWRLNRIKTVEENIFGFGLAQPARVYEHDRPEIENAVGQAATYLRRSRELDRLSQYEARLNRIVKTNMELLEKRQAARKAQTPPAPEPKPEPAPAQHFTAQNGFAQATAGFPAKQPETETPAPSAPAPADAYPPQQPPSAAPWARQTPHYSDGTSCGAPAE